ncbi:MAG: methyltransferase domain-containing protein, partial [Acidimicrobiia bacterium]|nr:methyltransferase domain-containing protein [Acidimicrobiia bacterium]
MWDPDQYLAYADHRRRPVLDLLARVPTGHVERIVDLGCGPGQLTELLRQRWPDATVVGVDHDPAMI